MPPIDTEDAKLKKYVLIREICEKQNQVFASNIFEHSQMPPIDTEDAKLKKSVLIREICEK